MMKSSSQRTRTVLAILLATICNLLMYHSLLALESRQVIVSPDALPTAVKVRLDDISLCELRNIRRRELQPPLPDLTCDANNPQLDPETYTMDEYVLGVLKQEVGPDATIAHWHIEALKAMAVTARTYGWYHATSLGAGTYEIRTLYLQAFFPEKNVSPDEARYQQAVVATTGLYLSHPTGKGSLMLSIAYVMAILQIRAL